MTEAPKPYTDEDGIDICDYRRHPGQQHAVGWSPRELARVVSAKVVSLCPDVCLTPIGNAVVPVPYAITATLTDDAKSCRTVKIEGLRTYNFGTIVTKCTGDEPGVKKGIKSGTVGGICEPKTHAPSVRIEGKPAIRNREIFYMNNKNTIGQLILQRSVDLHWD
jgi:hypothetical protein